MYPIRGAVTWKSTVGTNVASDALANLASGGVTGGALVIVGEDYGEGSSIMQERSHAFAMKSQIWLLDPRPNLESMVKAVEDGFSLSEASKTPVMLQLRIRGCHVHGRFIAKENKRPAFSLAQALESPARDTSRIVLPPASFLHEQEKIKDRWPAAIRYIKEHKLNEHFDGDQSDIGLILQGGLYNGVIRALQLLGLADHFGNNRIPLYVMNVTYPVIEDEVIDFCRDKRAVLLLEEGQPDYIEQNLHAVLRKAGIATQLSGKDVLPMAGEYTTQVMREGLREFLRRNRPESLQTHPAVAADAAAASAAQPEIVEIARARPARPVEQPITFHKHVEGLTAVVPPRPAGFCTGCPERPIFSALTLAQETLGQHHISCDIGCHLFSILPPFNLGATTMGYGLGASSAAAFNAGGQAPDLHHGRRRLLAQRPVLGHRQRRVQQVRRRHRHRRQLLRVGHRRPGHPVLARREPRPLHQQPHRPRRARRGRAMGAHAGSHLRRGKVRATIEEALTTDVKGPKVIIAQSECMLNKQRRIKPLFNKAVKEGKRAVKERFGVDPDVCTGDHACIRLSGCPSLTVKDSGDPLKEDPVAHVESSCVGCGNCGEVAHAAVLCPRSIAPTSSTTPPAATGSWPACAGGDRFPAAPRARLAQLAL